MIPAPRFLAILGPTASGKTALSLAVADRLDAEIVSMDSRQVYRGMDVGTAKVGPEERARVPHHGLDVVTPAERYSAGRYAREARGWIAEIEARGRVPLLVGGTGFFLKALMEPIFAEPDLDDDRKERLRAWLKARPEAERAAWVRRLDPSRAELSIEGGPHRVIRTLEVALLSGRPLSAWHREAPPEADGLPGAVVVLDLPRDVVTRRIDDRVGGLVGRGWVDEVRGLLEAGYDDTSPGMTGHGYREIAAYVRGEATLEEAMDEIRSATRRYARRQMTWFRNQLPASAVWIDATRPLQEQADEAIGAWHAARSVSREPDGATSRAEAPA